MAHDSTFAKGPIARRVLAQLRKAKHKKVVDAASWKEAQRAAEELLDEVSTPPEVSDQPRGFAVYAHATNFAVGFVELLLELPPLRRFAERIEKDEDEYMPSGPPMSPLTRSFFWHGMLWDLAVGVERETLGSILLAVGRELRMQPGFLSLLENLNASRLGLHLHDGYAGGHVVLRELVTNVRRRCICPAGYDGVPDQLWLARVLPSPIPALDESVVMTTPYVILQPDKVEWERYLDRTMSRIAVGDRMAAYANLMKCGLESRYWSEYVLEAYVNHVPEAIFLTGLPDVAESRPHSRVHSR